jgi:hypothetical protein
MKLFCRERGDRVADGFGSRADNFDSIVATESPSSNRGFGEVGSSVHKACRGTSKPDRHAHHGRCIVSGAIANIRRCCRRADQDESRQHRWFPGMMRIRVKSETLPAPSRSVEHPKPGAISYSTRGGADDDFGPTTGAGIPLDDAGSGAGRTAEPNARGIGAGAPDCCGSGAGARRSPDGGSAVGTGFAARAYGIPTTVTAILPLSVFNTKL